MNKTNSQQLNKHQPQADQRNGVAETPNARSRQVALLGLEVALALAVTVAQRVWSWAQEERMRLRVDRTLRDRISAS